MPTAGFSTCAIIFDELRRECKPVSEAAGAPVRAFCVTLGTNHTVGDHEILQMEVPLPHVHIGSHVQGLVVRRQSAHSNGPLLTSYGLRQQRVVRVLVFLRDCKRGLHSRGCAWFGFQPLLYLYHCETKLTCACKPLRLQMKSS